MMWPPEESNRGINPPEDRPKRKEKQNNRPRKLLSELLIDFAKNTTLHGLKYVTDRGLSVAEKIFWIITFLLSVSLCAFLMASLWIKWKNRPSVVSLSEPFNSVTEVPFPAVTICPQAKIKKSSFDYTENVQKFYLSYERANNSDEDLRSFENKTQLWNELMNIDLVCLFDVFPDNLKQDKVAVDTIYKAAPQLEDIMFMSKWRNKWVLEEELFDQVLTKEGLCFTFNSLPADEIFREDCIQQDYSYINTSTPRKGWSLEGGYSSSDHDTYPWRGRAKFGGPDLLLILNEVLDRDELCDGENQGYKVYLHHPADLPQSSEYYYTAIPGQLTSFAIKVNVLTDTLVSYPPDIRKCYFPGEKYLRYFKAYTLNNCQLECLANYTLAHCGCVWFHMPLNDSSGVCKIDKKYCMTYAHEQYAEKDGINNSKASSCQCLPPCYSIQYDAEVLKTNYNRRNLNYGRNIAYTLDSFFNFSGESKKYTNIEVYFKEPWFTLMRRQELFGLADFLADCGGLLGFFLGFSFLSLVEIFYFLTLRLRYMVRKEKTENKMDRREGRKIATKQF